MDNTKVSRVADGPILRRRTLSLDSGQVRSLVYLLAAPTVLRSDIGRWSLT